MNIFTTISALAQGHGAVNLGQGFPDFLVDARLTEALARAAAEGHNQYAPMAGLPLLRQRIAEDFSARHGVELFPEEEITVTPGATYGLYTALAATLRPGDEAIILEPAYDSYAPAVRQFGAVPVPVALVAPHFTTDFDAIRAALTPRTRAIVVNTPHNPSGAVWTTDDWAALAALLEKFPDVTVVSDEVYESIVFDGQIHASVLHNTALRARAFAVFSFGKAFHITGWKVGYCIAPPALTARFRNIHQYLAFSVSTPAQHALAAYLGTPGLEAPAPILQQKRDLLLELLEGTGFKVYEPAAGGWFQIASHADLSDEDDRAFAEWLITEKGVAVIPVSAFYLNGEGERLVRFCFAKEEKTLREAARRLG